MSRSIPCPNPGCRHRFTAAEAAGVAALVCPSCGRLVELAPPAALTPPPPPPVAVAPRGAGRWFPSQGSFLAWVLVTAASLAVAGMVGGVLHRRHASTRARGAQTYQSTEFNYRFLVPGPPWQRDDATRDRLGVNSFAFRRTRPDAWIALAVRDNPARIPAPAELREEALRHLRQRFQDVQFEDASGGGELGGQPAARLVFQGRADETVMSGDCHFLLRQGFAYWLFRWCPAEAVAQAVPELDTLLDGFAFLNQRPDWQPPRQTFTAPDAAYTITGEGDRWAKASFPPAEYDPRADLVLEASERAHDTSPLRRATLTVLRFPKVGGDALQEAKDHLLKREQETYPQTRLDEVPPADTGAPTEAFPGKVVGLKVSNTPDRVRFVLLGAAPQAGGAVVLWAECDFGRRGFWEPEFRRLFASLRLRP